MLRPALFALALLSAGAAFAAPNPPRAKPADISGAWGFLTDTYGPGCKLSGSMVIRPKGAGYSCTFRAREQCPDIDLTADETCVVTRQGDRLNITATVKKVSKNVGYLPDNFVLTIHSGSQMTGEMQSYHDAPVEFYRGDAPVS